MKVLVISNLYPPEIIGGYEMQCSQAVAALRQRGHEVVVLTSIPRRPVGGTESHVLRVLHTPDVYSRERAGARSPFWEFEANLLDAENVYLLLDVLQRWQPDVCYLWNLIGLGGVGLVGALEYLGVPWLWQLGDAVPALLCNFNGQLPELGAAMGRSFSGRFIACSQTVLSSVERVVPIGGRTTILPNWTLGTTATVDRSYYSGGGLRLVFAGRLAEEKGIFLALEMAADLLASGHSDFHLDVIGTGLDEEVAARIAELGLDGHAEMLGWLPPAEVKANLRQSDIMVFPASADDPMPIAALEAAASGCVPLLPWVSGVSEWLVDGVHCIKTERSPDGYASAVRAVMDGEVDLGQLARNGVAAVHESFDIEVVMPAVERELAVASAGRRAAAGSADDLYRMALLGDAMLRRHVMEMQQP